MARLPLAAALCAVLLPASALAARIDVHDVASLEAALAAAGPGDEVVLANGEYAITRSLVTASAGEVQRPVVVRAENRGAAVLRVSTLEGVKVQQPHWTFEGLKLVGACADDSSCEHAFHVTGKARGFVLRRSELVDFNAQIKVNATPDGAGGWDIPHEGLVEACELHDSRGRVTGNPVTKINIDTGDRWIVRGNFIHDFAKAGGNGVSYGAFMKSGGNAGVFEGNLVICTLDAPAGATRIGLSFGGGGTAPQFCAPAFDAQVPCDPEHTGGMLVNNVIAGCSDVGIYLNRSRDTLVLFNTLVGTAGVDFRFASTTGVAAGNLLEGKIRVRDGGTFTAADNRADVSAASFDGWYRAPLAGDLRVDGDVTELEAKAAARPELTRDYCGRERGAGPWTLGALEHPLGDCETVPPPSFTADGGSGGGGGSGAGGSGGTDDGGSGGAGGVGPGGSGGVAAGGSGGSMSGGSGPAGGSGGTPQPGEGGDAGGAVEDGSGGCDCSSSGGELTLLALAAAVLRPRRRR